MKKDGTRDRNSGLGKRLSLRAKVIASLAMMFVVVFGGMIYFNALNQRDHMMVNVEHGAILLANAVYNGMLYPMSMGDDKTIEQQMDDFKKNMKDVEVFIFKNDKSITYASEKEKERSDISKQIRTVKAAGALDQLLKDGKSPEGGYEEWIEGKPFLLVLRPILNESRCHQCHDPNQTILGGLMVKEGTGGIYRELASLRNENALFGIVGCIGVILVLSFLITRSICSAVGASPQLT